MFTTSLEVSKKLKEAGIVLETEWWWVGDKGELMKLSNATHWSSGQPYDRIIPAYTLGTLVRELPIPTMIYAKMPAYKNKGARWLVTGLIGQLTEADTPEDAAGLMLLKLKEGEGR